MPSCEPNKGHGCSLVVTDDLQAALQALRRGEVIAYPTETVYGLGVDPWNPEALARLFQLKGRAPDKGLILLIDGTDQLAHLAKPWSPLAQRLIDRFWPGPLTLVLPARPELPLQVTGPPHHGISHVAVRHSPSPTISALLKGWGKPLVSTSANPSGAPVYANAAAIAQAWSHELSVIIEEKTQDITWQDQSQPSTVVRVADHALIMLREGALGHRDLQAALD
ncbi:MAG: threonylcarbamoyl-AMP synthase [Magnetococcales bacterium]|nr:threonylcarbamoyl-AMP synthase [Magnetococcales bacterium]